MDQNLKREIILDNYQNPKNRGITHKEGYKLVNMDSDSCIDEVDIEMHIEDSIIKDIHFDGEACAICTSSSSIMTSILKDKTIKEAKDIINNFNNMIEEKEYDKELLQEAIVYEDISRQPNRKKCALLSWWGAQKLINEEEND